MSLENICRSAEELRKAFENYFEFREWIQNAPEWRYCFEESLAVDDPQYIVIKSQLDMYLKLVSRDIMNRAVNLMADCKNGEIAEVEETEEILEHAESYVDFVRRFDRWFNGQCKDN